MVTLQHPSYRTGGARWGVTAFLAIGIATRCKTCPPLPFAGCPPVRRRLVRVSVRLTRRDVYHGFNTAVNRPHGGRISEIDHPRVAVMPTHHAPAGPQAGCRNATRPSAQRLVKLLTYALFIRDCRACQTSSVLFSCFVPSQISTGRRCPFRELYKTGRLSYGRSSL